MRLPDYKGAYYLNKLRDFMGADLIDLSTVTWQSINTNELLERLNSLEGILVNVEEIIFCKDGTFEYENQKVLVYIRDQRMDPRYGQGEYKFHICNCSTIETYISNKRFDRYVVSTRTDGKFLVNVVNSVSNEYVEKGVIRELKVCKNCLMRLSYKHYFSHKNDTQIYSSFNLKEFFELYKKKFTTIPKYTDATAPPNLYDSGATLLNDKIKTYYNWECQNCGINLINHKKYLNIHHINGIKSDNRPENLECLCIKCHAEEPQHLHLKSSSEFYEFIKLF